jgi:hypothetical protein
MGSSTTQPVSASLLFFVRRELRARVGSHVSLGP